jgi:general stress protein 26
MNAEDPAVRELMRRSMVTRLATLSRDGRPSITPIYFVADNGHIWIGTVVWTLAARNVRAEPRVSALFEVECDSADRRMLRITGRAKVRTDRPAQRFYNRRVARKYLLTPGGSATTSPTHGGYGRCTSTTARTNREANPA